MVFHHQGLCKQTPFSYWQKGGSNARDGVRLANDPRHTLLVGKADAVTIVLAFRRVYGYFDFQSISFFG